MSAREAVLGGVREAISGAAAVTLAARDYRRAGTRAHGARVELFCERLGDYHADVRRIPAGRQADEIEAVCAALGARKLVIPAGLPAEVRHVGVELIEDTCLAPHELAALDGVVTGCTVAIAETGTIVLTAASHEGRRAISLVPDVHICLVEEHRIVELVPEAITRLAEAVCVERRPVTFISGPSATSDIELDRVEGVHGPRTLVVLVIERSVGVRSAASHPPGRAV